jgi:glutamate synthase domain-containing protein 3
MVSRVFYDENGKIIGHEVVDKFGQPVNIPHGTFPSSECSFSLVACEKGMDWTSNPQRFFRDRLPQWGFGEFKKALGRLTENFSVLRAVEELTRIYNCLPGWEIGDKDRGALLHIVAEQINEVLDRADGRNGMVRTTLENAGKLGQAENKAQVLVIDARGFKPEGIDHLRVLSCFLDHAHHMGWRRFIVYRVGGQRGIGMGMGSGSTLDSTLDVFGSPGEYCGAFNMGTLVRVHGHAQNFTGMVMHSGTLEIHGDVGKVTGYSAKGGTFNILGNVVDRGWVCAVSDPRGPGLEVNIVGTAYEHLCQAFMGGSVIMLGLFRGSDGILRRLPSPYSGAKILAGASAGEAIFYDPNGRLEEAQYKGCMSQPIDDKKWQEIMGRLMVLENIFDLGFSRQNSHLTVSIDEHLQTITPENFRWIIPKGELEGYH